MKSKTLITMAVASTFGFSAAAFAGNGHEVMTPFQPNEGGYVSVQHEGGLGSRSHTQDIGSTTSEAGGNAMGSSSFDQFAWSDQGASSPEDWMTLGDEGVYSEYYLVSLTPGINEASDYYLIDLGADEVASAEEILFLTPTYDVVFIQDMSEDIASDLGE